MNRMIVEAVMMIASRMHRKIAHIILFYNGVLT